MENNQTSTNFFSGSKESEEIDLGKIFRFLLMQSKLIITVSLVVFILSFANYYFSTKKYLIQSLLQYEAVDQNIFDPSQALQMASSNYGSDVINLIELYESRTNYLKVIRDLKLNIIPLGLDDDENIDISITSEIDNNLGSRKLKFSFSENEYVLLDEDANESTAAKYGEIVRYDGLIISIDSVNLNEYRPIEINFSSPESVYKALKIQMDVDDLAARNSFFRNEALITISYISSDIEKGKDIINYANKIFIEQRISDETEKSRKAITFIDNNINAIEESVELDKIKLKQFREKNKSIDVTLEIESIINKVQALEESLSAVEIEIANAQELYTSNNPVYLNLLSKKSLIESQKQEVLNEIEMMPKEQQEYIDLYNELEISQALFEELESRRLGFSILEASTIGDIRIVDEAYVVEMVSPRLMTVLMFTFIAFVVSCFFAIIRGFNFLPISNPAEIFDNGITTPIIGVIPEVKDFDFSDDNLRLESAIQSLIVNINSLQQNQFDKKIITITSPTPGNGKSTICMKLAEGLAKIDKKVLLVDNDLKRGKIASNYNIKSISERTFNSINESNIEDFKVHENFYIIPRVKGLTNTFQFLYSYQYKDKVKFFKDNFDFIIFDTGPILSVADSSVLIEQSDFNFLVARHAINRMNEIKQSIDNFRQISNDVDGVIYNAYAKPKSYYGYYGLYGNYSYQYYAEKYLDETYEYKKDEDT